MMNVLDANELELEIDSLGIGWKYYLSLCVCVFFSSSLG